MHNLGQPAGGDGRHSMMPRELDHFVPLTGLIGRGRRRTGVEQRQPLDPFRRNPHDLERDAPAHGVTRQREAVGGRFQNHPGHRDEGIVTVEIVKNGNPELSRQCVLLRRPNSRIAQQSGQ